MCSSGLFSRLLEWTGGRPRFVADFLGGAILENAVEIAQHCLKEGLSQESAGWVIGILRKQVSQAALKASVVMTLHQVRLLVQGLQVSHLVAAAGAGLILILAVDISSIYTLCSIWTCLRTLCQPGKGSAALALWPLCNVRAPIQLPGRLARACHSSAVTSCLE